MKRHKYNRVERFIFQEYGHDKKILEPVKKIKHLIYRLRKEGIININLNQNKEYFEKMEYIGDKHMNESLVQVLMYNFPIFPHGTLCLFENHIKSNSNLSLVYDLVDMEKHFPLSEVIRMKSEGRLKNENYNIPIRTKRKWKSDVIEAVIGECYMKLQEFNSTSSLKNNNGEMISKKGNEEEEDNGLGSTNYFDGKKMIVIRFLEELSNLLIRFIVFIGQIGYFCNHFISFERNLERVKEKYEDNNNVLRLLEKNHMNKLMSSKKKRKKREGGEEKIQEDINEVSFSKIVPYVVKKIEKQKEMERKKKEMNQKPSQHGIRILISLVPSTPNQKHELDYSKFVGILREKNTIIPSDERIQEHGFGFNYFVSLSKIQMRKNKFINKIFTDLNYRKKMSLSGIVKKYENDRSVSDFVDRNFLVSTLSENPGRFTLGISKKRNEYFVCFEEIEYDLSFLQRFLLTKKSLSLKKLYSFVSGKKKNGTIMFSDLKKKIRKYYYLEIVNNEDGEEVVTLRKNKMTEVILAHIMQIVEKGEFIEMTDIFKQIVFQYKIKISYGNLKLMIDEQPEIFTVRKTITRREDSNYEKMKVGLANKKKTTLTLDKGLLNQNVGVEVDNKLEIEEKKKKEEESRKKVTTSSVIAKNQRYLDTIEYTINKHQRRSIEKSLTKGEKDKIHDVRRYAAYFKKDETDNKVPIYPPKRLPSKPKRKKRVKKEIESNLLEDVVIEYTLEILTKYRIVNLQLLALILSLHKLRNPIEIKDLKDLLGKHKRKIVVTKKGNVRMRKRRVKKKKNDEEKEI